MLRVIGSSSAGNAYGYGPLLLEAGLCSRDIMRGLNFKAPAACLITHEHGDHAKSAGDLARLGVPIWASAGTLDALGIKGHAVKHGEPILVAGFWVVGLNAVHDATEPMMFVISSASERILFATDTAEIPYELNGLTDIAIEVNYCERLMLESAVDIAGKIRTARSHLSLETAVRWLKETDLTRCRSITLLHLSDGHSDEALFRKTIEEETGIPTIVAEKRK